MPNILYLINFTLFIMFVRKEFININITVSMVDFNLFRLFFNFNVNWLFIINFIQILLFFIKLNKNLKNIYK